MTKTKKIHNMNKKHTRKNKYTKKAHKLKKRVKQPNKRFRKTRSKRQRGGNQEENQEENQEKKDKSLFDAINIGNIDEVDKVLKSGANVNAKNDAGDTPLICAITSDNIIYYTKYDMVKLLLDQPNIEFNNDTVRLAEREEENDQDQGGIPYLIESYILAKNEIKNNRDKNIEEIREIAERMRKLKIPPLTKLACEKLTDEQKQYIARCSLGLNDDGSFGIGGKRKTRKSKQKRRLN